MISVQIQTFNWSSDQLPETQADEDFSERKRNIFITETEKLKSLGIERDKEALAIILSWYIYLFIYLLLIHIFIVNLYSSCGQ